MQPACLSALFLDNVEDRLVILDEIHRMPTLFRILRGVIDRGRRRWKGTGRFLMVGSASIDLLHRTGKTLAGRIAYVDMIPLSALEADNLRATRERLWLRGGLLDSFLAESDEISLALRRDFIQTCLMRDVAEFGPRLRATTLGRLWTMFAHCQGTMLNARDALHGTGDQRAVGDPLRGFSGQLAAGAPGEFLDC